MNKNNKPRHSLNNMLQEELANVENTPLAGETSSSVPSVSSSVPKKGRGETIPTKKVTTIIPKELFLVLQNYCSATDTPKHRVICRFILDGLHAAQQLSDADYSRFLELSEQITTTYEKKK